MPLTGEYAPSTSEWAREQAELYERTNGAEGNDMRGRPIIVLTTLGAKSGMVRKTALMRVEHEGVYAVVASKGGAPQSPEWHHNLSAHSLCELQDMAEKHDYRARLVEGSERDLWWERSLAAWPDYAQYQTKTDRLIPVWVLERAGA
jgi:deazaflavin-dependent oxidoreductase (nitroreductase family)